MKGQIDPPIIEITSTPTNAYLSSYLNGIARNNYEGYIDRNGTGIYTEENQYDAKLNIYRNLPEDFSGGGRPLYRIGHDISDGSMSLNNPFTGHIHPGWHWATDYKTGFNFDVWKAANRSNSIPPIVDVCGDDEIVPVRFGAGVHRFFFSSENLSGAIQNVAFVAFGKFHVPSFAWLQSAENQAIVLGENLPKAI